jgi:hypothetical protein
MIIGRRNNLGEVIPYKSFDGFIKNGEHVYFTKFAVYADGIINCWGEVDIEGFKQKIKEGWVCLSPKEGDEIHFDGFYVVAKEICVFCNDTEERILNTINSIIDELNGIDWNERCVNAFNDWYKNKTEDNRKILEDCYLKVPEQDRRYLLGDMDNKDIPIRVAIYGNKEIKGHVHFAVSRMLVETEDLDKLGLNEEQKELIRLQAKVFDNPEILEDNW